LACWRLGVALMDVVWSPCDPVRPAAAGVIRALQMSGTRGNVLSTVVMGLCRALGIYRNGVAATGGVSNATIIGAGVSRWRAMFGGHLCGPPPPQAGEPRPRGKTSGRWRCWPCVVRSAGRLLLSAWMVVLRFRPHVGRLTPCAICWRRSSPLQGAVHAGSIRIDRGDLSVDALAIAARRRIFIRRGLRSGLSADAAFQRSIPAP